jgi:ankyrin repeat protein
MRPLRKITLISLDAGVNVNLSDDEGMTALHWAAKNGSLEITDLLLDAGRRRMHPEEPILL